MMMMMTKKMIMMVMILIIGDQLGLDLPNPKEDDIDHLKILLIISR